MAQYYPPPGAVPVSPTMPQDLVPPDGFTLLESFASSEYFDIQPGEVVDISTTGFTAYTLLGFDIIESTLKNLALTLADQ